MDNRSPFRFSLMNNISTTWKSCHSWARLAMNLCEWLMDGWSHLRCDVGKVHDQPRWNACDETIVFKQVLRHIPEVKKHVSQINTYPYMCLFEHRSILFAGSGPIATMISDDTKALAESCACIPIPDHTNRIVRSWPQAILLIATCAAGKWIVGIQ